MKNTKINFFNRIKKAIFKFDEYEKFITEQLSKAIGYFAKIIIIFSIIITISLLYKINTQTKETLEIINNVFPNFTIENSKLQLEENSFEHYFENINLEVIMDKNEVSIQNGNYPNLLALMQDRLVLKYNGISREVLYKDILSEPISKITLLKINKTKQWTLILISVGIVMFAVSYLVYFIVFFMDVITLAILGLIINLIIKTAFKFKDILKIAIYAMTLPIILYLIYIVLNVLFGTTIKYFEIAYNTISYIYLITVLLIMKSDIIKNTQELQKILEEQKKVKEELEREKQEEKEKQDEANRKPRDKKKEKSKEPSGGEPQAEN